MKIQADLFFVFVDGLLLGEEGVGEGLGGCRAKGFVFLQQLDQQVKGIRSQHLILLLLKINPNFFILLENSIPAPPDKGRLANQQHMENDPHRENIRLDRIQAAPLLIANDLRGHIPRRPTFGEDHIRVVLESGQPEIDYDKGIALRGDQHVLGLEVAMHDVGGGEALDPAEDLAQDSSDLGAF